MATLNEVMKETADAIREKKGTTDLIAPVDFASEIKGISGGSGSGELEGEHFLAKPNGRYWKFSFIDDVTRYYIDYSELSQDELNALESFCSMIMPAALIYGAAVGNAGSPFDSELRANIFQVTGRADSMQEQIQMIKDGAEDYVNPYSFNAGFCIVWLEGQVETSSISDKMPFHKYDLVSYIKQLGSMQGYEMTDDDVMMMLQEFFMLIPATEEEYKAARREN